MKKHLRFSAILLLAAIGFCPKAQAYDVEVDGIYYNLNKSAKTATVTYQTDNGRSGSDYAGEIMVPETFVSDGTTYTVTTIGQFAFYSCPNVTKVTLPNTVTSIQNVAFQHCTNLASINLPENITSLGYWTFSDCSSLAEIIVPEKVTRLEVAVFNNCAKLETIELSPNINYIDYPSSINNGKSTLIIKTNALPTLGNGTVTVGLVYASSELQSAYENETDSKWTITEIKDINIYNIQMEADEATEVLQSVTKKGSALITASSQITTNASTSNLANLIDNNTGTYWQSWKNTTSDKPYLQVELTDPISNFYLKYNPSLKDGYTQQDAVNDLTVEGSNDGTSWAYIMRLDKNMPVKSQAEYNSPLISAKESYSKLRFTTNSTVGNRDDNGNSISAYAEFQLYDVEVSIANVAEAAATLNTAIANARYAANQGSGIAEAQTQLKQARAALEALLVPGYIELTTYYNSLDASTSGYTSPKYTPATIAAFSTAYNNAGSAVAAADGTTEEYESLLQALQNAVAAMTLVTIENGYYYIQSAYSGFASKQSEYTEGKGLYSFHDAYVGWDNLDRTSPYYLWKITKLSSSAEQVTYSVQNVGCDKYFGTSSGSLVNLATSGTEQEIVCLGSDQYMFYGSAYRTSGDRDYHPNYHSNGAGINGTLIRWSNISAKDNHNAWKFIAATEAEVAAALSRKATEELDEVIAESYTRGESGIITDASQITCNAPQTGNSYASLIDDDTSTLFESSWGKAIANPHYLQIDLSESPVSKVYLEMKARETSYTVYYVNRPRKITVYGSNDGANWDEVSIIDNLTNAYPYNGGGWGSFLTAENPELSTGYIFLNLGKEYSQLRFAVNRTNTTWNHTYQGSALDNFFALSELQLYPATPKETIEIAGELDELAMQRIAETVATDDAAYLIDLSGATISGTPQSITSGNPNALIAVANASTVANTNNVLVKSGSNYTCSNLVLTDGSSFAVPTGFTATNASYARNVPNEWATVCLPFAVESNDAVTYYTTGKITGEGDKAVLTLTETKTMAAGVPAIAKFATTGSNTIAAENAAVVAAAQDDADTSDDITLVGTFTKQTLSAKDNPNMYYISGGKFWHSTGSINVAPFRAYFTTGSSTGASGFSIAVNDDDLTAINALTGEGDIVIEAIYTVDGKQVADLQKGVNIVRLSNGKTQKIVVR